MKKIPVLTSLITVQDIQAWYNDNPLKPSKASISFPLVRNLKGTTWKTISNNSLFLNEAADPISLNSKTPVSGRPGFKSVMGDMGTFGKGREMDADEIERFEALKIEFANTQNPQIAQQLLDYYGDDLAFLRQAMQAEKSYLTWALISAACNIGFIEANSPYLQGLTQMAYPLSTWQKDAVSTSWANAAANILDDIQNVMDVAETYSKTLRTITINKKWFDYVRKNTQIQKYCATLVQNLYDVQAPPTLEAINAMMDSYFQFPVVFNVIDERVTRASIEDVKTTENPFADGVAVFSLSPVLGHFEWNSIPILDPTKEVAEDFFIVGNKIETDPSYSKTYVKGRGFPVVDTFADNFYLKVNAVSW